MNPWPASLEKAKGVQNHLRRKLRIEPLKKLPRIISGCDASFHKEYIIGVISTFTFPHLKLVEEKFSQMRLKFPYVPGFLSFREGPVLEKVFYSLHIKPDLLIFDGQGFAHPKGLGLASHLGVILNLPTVGCAKTRLYGLYKEPGSKKGSFSYLLNPETRERIGVVLRTKDNTRPLFISAGNLITIREAKNIVLSCCLKFRLPEPLRRSHHVAQMLKLNLPNFTK